jgi:hypothetical protein
MMTLPVDCQPGGSVITVGDGAERQVSAATITHRSASYSATSRKDYPEPYDPAFSTWPHDCPNLTLLAIPASMIPIISPQWLG